MVIWLNSVFFVTFLLGFILTKTSNKNLEIKRFNINLIYYMYGCVRYF